MTSRHPKSWMWAQALQMLDEADQLQRRFFTEVGARDRAAPTWEPPVDVFTADDEVWLFFAVPGVAAEQVQVLVDPAGALVVHPAVTAIHAVLAARGLLDDPSRSGRRRGDGTAGARPRR